MKYIDRTNGHRLERVGEENGQAVFKDVNAKYPTVIRCNQQSDFLMSASELDRPMTRRAAWGRMPVFLLSASFS